MFDVDGNLLLLIVTWLEVIFGLIFFLLPWDSFLDKALKLFFGSVFFILLGYSFFILRSDTEALEVVRKGYEKEILGEYYLDEFDSSYDKEITQNPDTILLILNENHEYSLNYKNFSFLGENGRWHTEVGRMYQSFFLSEKKSMKQNLVVDYEGKTIFISTLSPNLNFERLVFRKKTN